MKKTYEKHQALSHYDQYIEQKKVFHELKTILDNEKNNKSILCKNKPYIEISSVSLDCLFLIETSFKKNFEKIIIDAISCQKAEMNITLEVCEEEIKYMQNLLKKEKNKKGE